MCLKFIAEWRGEQQAVLVGCHCFSRRCGWRYSVCQINCSSGKYIVPLVKNPFYRLPHNNHVFLIIILFIIFMFNFVISIIKHQHFSRPSLLVSSSLLNWFHCLYYHHHRSSSPPFSSLCYLHYHDLHIHHLYQHVHHYHLYHHHHRHQIITIIILISPYCLLVSSSMLFTCKYSVHLRSIHSNFCYTDAQCSIYISVPLIHIHVTSSSI